ncbi:FABP family protein [Schumannella sp. 10F1B-5-1]|uniref:FABP family protein n=1 Tax=Schumannella sp. 10F1B-5-1 TaxID=2590780 RepID=UPI00113117D8|nr:FABP family protein [Schumannella sp. 10F1B-5-1]TPW72838.1 FABP family protein [Schumannella sp. 10F1B-5-1]
MFDLDAGVPAELGPLSWLLGVWEGTGVIAYKVGDEIREHEFGQRIAFTHDGLPVLNYSCYVWLPGENEDDAPQPLYTETGYWRLARPRVDGDVGPAMLPGVGERPFTTAESVESLRNEQGSFDIEVSLVQPGGVSEVYIGAIAGPRIDLATDAVMRTAGAKEYAAATRLYGLVDSHLLWAWDIAALGQDLRTHASGRLSRVD